MEENYGDKTGQVIYVGSDNYWHAVNGKGSKLEYTIQTNVYKDKNKVETFIWVETEQGIYDLVYNVVSDLENSYPQKQHKKIINSLIKGELDLEISDYFQRINNVKNFDGLFEKTIEVNADSNAVDSKPEDNYSNMGFNNLEEIDNHLEELFKSKE
ncbi:MAG TPA: hypothetical protein VJH65_03700 [Candidatus Nanoarchaeia archaeon]|nr:hypothetical protein [Candidatus Nanoarchaeia archaeon]